MNRRSRWKRSVFMNQDGGGSGKRVFFEELPHEVVGADVAAKSAEEGGREGGSGPCVTAIFDADEDDRGA